MRACMDFSQMDRYVHGCHASGGGEITYAYSNEDGSPFGLSSADIYADLAKLSGEQSMQIRDVPTNIEARMGLYGHRQ